MIKGVNHTIIEVSNPCNQYFERALLFIRPQAEQIKNQELQREADLFVNIMGKPPHNNPLLLQKQRKNRKIFIYICNHMVHQNCQTSDNSQQPV